MLRVQGSGSAGGFSRRSLLAAGAASAALAAAGPVLARQATSHAIEDFFQPDRTIGAAISPNGEKLAVLKQSGSGDDRVIEVEVYSTSDFSQALSRSRLGDFDADRLVWGSDERLLISLIQIDSRDARIRSEGGVITDERITHASRRMISLDTNNGGAVVLFENQRNSMAFSRDLGRVVDLLPNDPEHVLMMARYGSVGTIGLFRVNIVTGAADRIEQGTDATIGWRTQFGEPVLRVDMSPHGTYETIYARTPGSSEWRQISRRRTETPEFTVIAPTDRLNVFIVAARRDGEDVISMRELDLTTNTYGPPLTNRTDRDVSFGMVDGAGEYLGAGYYGDRLEYALNVPALNAHHRALNGFFGGASNVHFNDVSRDRNRVLTYVEGPQDPGSWHLYDIAARNVEALGFRTGLDPARLSPTEALDVPTRDGQAIRAYLTGPLHGGPGPLVVMVHGGPDLRDTQSWDKQVQILTAQGWWVLQPNFRGSGGYGQAFSRAGWREWGGRMQHDVEDSVAHAIAHKGLDAGRVAIIGGSYGGYAALMGAVMRPDLYKAAIGYAGVYDLVQMMEYQRSADPTPDDYIYGFWRDRIGDPQADLGAVRSASPRHRASEVSCPILLVHGDLDRTVPPSQTEGMRRALRDAGKSVDFIEIRNAGHGDWAREVDQEIWRRYIDFLRRALA